MAAQSYDLARIYDSYRWYCRSVDVRPLAFNDWNQIANKAKANGSDFILDYRRPRRRIEARKVSD